MKKMMQKIMLSCKQATFLSANKGHKKMKWLQLMQHEMHLLVCKHCKLFDKQSQQIDKAINKVHSHHSLPANEHLSTEKKSNIKLTVKHYL
jgi:hypothetical protein